MNSLEILNIVFSYNIDSLMNLEKPKSDENKFIFIQ